MNEEIDKINQHVHMLLFMVCSLLAIGIVTLIGMTIWPYLHQIGIGICVILSLIAIGGLLDLASHLRHRHRMRETEYQKALLSSKVIEAAGIAAYVSDNDNLYHLSAYAENAKTFPVQIEETTKEDIDLVKELASKGNSERQIAGRMNMSRGQVRKLLGK